MKDFFTLISYLTRALVLNRSVELVEANLVEALIFMAWSPLTVLLTTQVQQPDSEIVLRSTNQTVDLLTPMKI